MKLMDRPINLIALKRTKQESKLDDQRIAPECTGDCRGTRASHQTLALNQNNQISQTKNNYLGTNSHVILSRLQMEQWRCQRPKCHNT